MIDPIEEGLQVHIHHPAVSCPDVRLHFAHGLMGRTLRAKSVAVGVKVRFPLRRYDLRDGLLNEAVQHGGDAQGAVFPSPFGISTRLTGCGR